MAATASLRLGGAGLGGAAAVAVAQAQDPSFLKQLGGWGWRTPQPSAPVGNSQLPAVPQSAAVPPSLPVLTGPPTNIYVRSGSSWKAVGVVGSAVACFIAWKQWHGFTWEDIVYVTKSSFDEGVSVLEASIRTTSEAIRTTREQLHEQLGLLEIRVTETGQELELKIEGQVGLARDDIAELQRTCGEMDAVVQKISSGMATASQVGELSDLVVETSRTARHTSGEVRQMHNALNSQSGQLQDLSNDMTELKSMVSEQTGELRSWMRAQLEAAINAKLLGARPNMLSESAESNPATPPDAPDQDQEDTGAFPNNR